MAPTRDPNAAAFDRHGHLRLDGPVPSVLRTLASLVTALGDLRRLLFLRQRPARADRLAFLIHPRDVRDIYRPFPALRYLGDGAAQWLGCLIPPLHLSAIEIDGQDVGDLITIVMTPRMMARFPKWSALMARWAVLLAAKRGARVIGLGALMPMLTRYGTAVAGLLRYAKVTIGHGYTAYTIVRQLEAAADTRGEDLAHATIAICGAAGSTGMATVRGLVALHGDALGPLLLIDRRLERARRLADELLAERPTLDIRIHAGLPALALADYGVVVTNAPDAIIRPEHVKPGAVLLDDSQPRNTDPALVEAVPGLTLLDVLSSVPGLNVHFDWGLLEEQPSVTFTCLAETVALMQSGRAELGTVGQVQGQRVVDVGTLAESLGIRPAPLTSFYRLVAEQPRTPKPVASEHLHSPTLAPDPYTRLPLATIEHI